MVFWFESSDGHIIYMGKDKYENEDLIKYGWDEDIWFHVDDLSSAHVYLRLKKKKIGKIQTKNYQWNVANQQKKTVYKEKKRKSRYCIYSLEQSKQNEWYGSWCNWISLGKFEENNQKCNKRQGCCKGIDKNIN
ncbi:coiled-coil domain protein [Ichthyophthirius multifiliis]|uniref:Coiled-coil domain protein n=1 Tax=Ichthyophthirius multifiliis TaxID=5932 RepID=G0QTV7_ICHMU|nr:coiled-coil domain protein [Ichthyophthirius multifiliis]EGR31345.1 coiled-coil domain protein [Ichthyophthirius multifiliis]|eukprot:XP_004034831.1 coiled-coil domain protein [Ichthyophthirius multifiliis]